MGLRAVFAAALPDIFDAAGEDAVFTPAAGAAIPCKIFIEFDVALQPEGTTAQVWEQGTTIEALISEITRAPARGETFTYDSVVYTMKAVISNDGLTVKVAVT
jgi:hypothetical protein